MTQSTNATVTNAKLVIGNVGMPGAPLVHLTLSISEGTVGGVAHITQALPPPLGNYTFPVTGKVYQTGLGKNMTLISLEGQFVVSVPPPAIGSFLAQFKASMAVDSTWNGHGGFSYANTHVENVPVKPE